MSMEILFVNNEFDEKQRILAFCDIASIVFYQ